MKKCPSLISILLRLCLGAALVSGGLGLTGPALADGGSNESGRKPQPLNGLIDHRVEKGRAGFNIEFDSKILIDQELIFKELNEDERPFTLSVAAPIRVFWKSDRVLRIESDSSLQELEAILAPKPIDLTWKKSFRNVEGQGANHVRLGSQNRADRIYPLIIDDSRVNKRGEFFNRVHLAPYEVKLNASGPSFTASLQLSFTRLMVPPEMVGQRLKMEDAPFKLEPNLPLTGSWRDQRTLVFNHTFGRDEFWEKICDQPFKLTWQNDFKNLMGQTVPPLSRTESSANLANGFYFSRFAFLGFDQAAMNLDGFAEFDLGFNKPVSPDEVAASLKLEKFLPSDPVSGRKAQGYRPVEFEVTGVGGPGDEAGATAHLKVRADSGERLRLTIDSLKSADGRGRLSQTTKESTVDRFFTLAGAKLEIEDNYPWRPYFSVNVREPLIFDDIEKFIRLDPPLKFTVSPYGQEGNSIQIFADFNAQTPTSVSLLRGLRSHRGVLTEDLTYTAQVPADTNRKLMFTGRGRYLSPDRPLLVKLAGRNVERVRLQAWRVYENNLAAIINIQDYDSHTRMRLTQQFSKNIVDRETDVNEPAGSVFERLVDLKQVMEGTPKGAYILKISPLVKPKDKGDEARARAANNYEPYYDYTDYYNYGERYLPVMISDLGLSAHVLPGRVSIWVNRLSDAQPVPEGRVKFYDRANQVLAEGLTDAGGIFSGEVDFNQVVFVSVEKGGDLNYLTFGSSSRRSSSDDGEDEYYGEYDDYGWHEDGDSKWYGGDGAFLQVTAPASAFGPMRDYLVRGYEAFMFMPRDIFKPGETARFKAMVRDRDMLPPAGAFPVMWRINDPDGRVISQGKAEMNQQGGVDFASEIPFSGKTGSYEAQISLPESNSPIGRVSFTVEDFVPPRLSVELAPGQKIYQGLNPEITLNSEVKYLFGAPGTDLNWELDAVVFQSSFHPKGWDGFDFTGPVVDFHSISQRRAAQGQLDEEGRAEIRYQPGLEAERLPNKLSIEFVFSAQEDGGRWNAKRARVDFFPRELILGSKKPDSALIEQPFNFEVAALTPEGLAADRGQLKVQVSKVKNRYFNSYRYGRHYRQSVEELVEQQQFEVALKEGRGAFDFTPDTAGTYEVMVTDEATGWFIKDRVRVYGLAVDQEAVSVRSPVELSLDRESYRPGDRATVKVKSPFPGRLWLTVETTEVLFSHTQDMPSTEAEVSFLVSAAIKANAQVTATVLRPLATGETVYRAVGLKSLEIDRSIYKLNLAAEMPGQIKPSSKVPLRLRLSDHQGRPVAGEVTVSLVDEGVLSLANFKTPDPWRMFVVGRNLATRFYDLYEQLLPLEKTTVPFLRPGGGDGLGRSGLFSPFKRNQEILSIFLASVPVGPDGLATVELDIPEYSGQGRLMVVASSRDRFGSLARDIRISRDLTAEATLPLALAPGDKFEMPLRVFLAAEASAQAGQKAAVSLKTEGPLSLVGTGRAEFNLQPGQGETSIFQALAEPADKKGDRAGVGRLIIESRSGLGEVFSQTLEVVVRPPYPRVAVSTSAQLEQSETPLTISTEGYLPGTVEAVLTLAKSPAIEAARAVDYLRNYPYGCLEQTTSRAWIFVAAEDLLVGLDPEAARSEHIKYGLDAAIKRLTTMQTNSGGFAGWPGDTEVDEWSTAYAAHFLTEAGKKTELPRNLKERALGWLENYLSASYSGTTNDAAYVLATRAYACYVLALNGDYRAGWVNSLKERYAGLNPSARIFLAGAEAVHEGNSRALKALDTEEMDLQINTLGHRYSSLESEPRNQALKLMVWSEVDPLAPATSDLAWRVADQGRRNLWSNTQENGLAVFALGGYLNKSAVGQPYQASLLDTGGRPLFTAGNNDVAVLGPKALSQVLDQELKLKIEGQGRPYYTLTVAGVPLSPPEPKAEKLFLKRTWIMEDESELELSSPDDTAKTISVRKGDRVTVRIRVNSPEAIQNLVLVDLLPGGFEIENPKLIPPSEDADGNESDQAEQAAADSRLEIREDRLVLIEPWIRGSGSRTYFYTMRAITPGEYILPGTMAEGMYEPDRQAILPGGKVQVVR